MQDNEKRLKAELTKRYHEYAEKLRKQRQAETASGKSRTAQSGETRCPQRRKRPGMGFELANALLGVQGFNGISLRSQRRVAARQCGNREPCHVVLHVQQPTGRPGRRKHNPRVIRNGTVGRGTAVWKEGMQSWSVAGTTELQARLARMPPTPPPYHGPTVRCTSVPAYPPSSFKTLWLWFAWLAALGLPLSAVIIGLPLLMAATVISCILLYRFWDMIQGGTRSTSPGKAVGFCFIPFFNVYWCYVAIVGLAEDVNGYCDQRNIEGPRVSERGSALAWYMLSLLNTLFSLLCQLIIGTRFTSEWLLLYSLADVAPLCRSSDCYRGRLDRLPIQAVRRDRNADQRGVSLRYCSKFTALNFSISSRLCLTRSRSAAVSGRTRWCSLRITVCLLPGVLPGDTVRITCEATALRSAKAAFTAIRACGGQDVGPVRAFRREYQSEKSRYCSTTACSLRPRQPQPIADQRAVERQFAAGRVETFLELRLGQEIPTADRIRRRLAASDRPLWPRRRL